MEKSRWYTELSEATKSAIQQQNLKKVHYSLKNGKEMVEEYNIDTKCLTRRAWKLKNEVGNEIGWNIEIGDPEPAAFSQTESEHIRVNPNQPLISRRITKHNFEWRIRNLPYKVDVYTVSVEDNDLVIRTSNKKYFKRIQIPELQRLNLKPHQDCVSFTHKFNTLIITYKKPAECIQLEELIYTEIVEKVQPKNLLGSNAPNPNDCKTS